MVRSQASELCVLHFQQLADRSIILKTEWEKTGAGWQKYLHFSEPESGCLESVRLPR